jgi:glutaredoxin
MKINIYTTPNCFHCSDIKRQLEAEQIEYQEYNAIEYRDELGDQLELPVLKYDGKILDVDEIINLNWIIKNKKISPK